MDQKTLKEQVLYLLRGGGAHLSFDEGIEGLPPTHRAAKPSGVPHSPWRLLEHMRRTQRDIVDFVRDPGYVSPEWPAGYWPPTDGPVDDEEWEASLAAFRTDLVTVQELVADPAADLLMPLPHAPDYTLLREALLVADHNAYHLGELVVVRRALGVWTRS